MTNKTKDDKDANATSQAVSQDANSMNRIQSPPPAPTLQEEGKDIDETTRDLPRRGNMVSYGMTADPRDAVPAMVTGFSERGLSLTLFVPGAIEYRTDVAYGGDDADVLEKWF